MSFEPQYPLSSDLDWLLISGQVDDDAMIEALVQECFEALFHQVFILLDDQEAASQALIETFSQAPQYLHQYRSEDGPIIWLSSIAVDACQGISKRLKYKRALRQLLPYHKKPRYGISAPLDETDAILWRCVDDLRDEIRYPFLLHYVNDWSVPELSRILQTEESLIRSWLKSGRRDCLNRVGHLYADLGGDNFDHILSKSLKIRWPVDLSSDVNPQLIMQKSLSNLQSRGAQKRRVISIKEVLLIGAAILVLIGLIWGGDLLSTVVDTIRTPTPTLPIRRPPPTSTPLPTPTHTPTVSPTPIGLLLWIVSNI